MNADPTESSLPSETGVARAELRVSDLGATVDFYRDVVGLTVRDRTETDATLGTPERRLLDLRAAPDAPARGRGEAGLFHLAFLLPSRAALGAALERIEGTWELSGASDHVVSEALYLRDPEGNGVEIYRDTPPETWPRSDGRVGIDTLPLDLDAVRAAHTDRNAAASEESVPPETKLGHVHLEVTDLDAAVGFYRDGIGFGVTHEHGDEAAFLAAGDYHHHLGLNTWQGRREPKREDGRGLVAYEIAVPDAVALEAVAERLADTAGIDIEDGPADGALAVTDPDGIRVRIVVED
ncbi:VOC family protein [Haloparvum alkalitolerans]|uniref:VOC family protein n=1 Tax=Haloparvum alkalitolerans TaxID=1042953 RepID=UPI003CEDF628